jgi:hypothetical protein
MHYSSGRPCAETLSLPFRDHLGQRPISAQKLVNLIDLGWSDYRIACHFCVEPEKDQPFARTMDWFSRRRNLGFGA